MVQEMDLVKAILVTAAIYFELLVPNDPLIAYQFQIGMYNSIQDQR